MTTQTPFTVGQTVYHKYTGEPFTIGKISPSGNIARERPAEHRYTSADYQNDQRFQPDPEVAKKAWLAYAQRTYDAAMQRLAWAQEEVKSASEALAAAQAENDPTFADQIERLEKLPRSHPDVRATGCGK